tara:strand:- start:1330 stop:1965 length:636 start_codon:yes stop_codon:yes gene_type:complete
MHCDQHVYKMTLETTQILYTALSLLSIKLPDLVESGKHGESGKLVAPYKPTHSKHPCVLWTAACANHFWWTLCLGRSLAAQSFWRPRKSTAPRKPHRCQMHLDHIFRHFALVCAVLPETVDAPTWLRSLDGSTNVRVATMDPPEGCKFGVVAFEFTDEATLARGWVACYRACYAHKRKSNIENMTWGTRACDPAASDCLIDVALDNYKSAN